jgi:hypothetical protein
MTTEEHRKLLSIRKRAKLGEHITNKETEFCQTMWAKWPEEYKEMDRYIRDWAYRRMNPMADR